MDYDSDISDESTYDELYEAEEEFLDRQKKDGEYVIGMFRVVRGVPLYAIGLTPHTFFKHDYDTIVRYMRMYSIVQIYVPEVNILKIVHSRHHITSNVSFISTEVINKTLWLRLIQRHWRKAFHTFRIRQKNCIWELRGTSSLVFPDIRKGGKVGLRGLMSKYTNKNI